MNCNKLTRLGGVAMQKSEDWVDERREKLLVGAYQAVRLEHLCLMYFSVLVTKEVRQVGEDSLIIGEHCLRLVHWPLIKATVRRGTPNCYCIEQKNLNKKRKKERS
jgi:hypothetical protein